MRIIIRRMLELGDSPTEVMGRSSNRPNGDQHEQKEAHQMAELPSGQEDIIPLLIMAVMAM